MSQSIQSEDSPLLGPEKYSEFQTPKEQNRIRFYFWLFLVTFSLSGVQFVYSIQFAIGTPLFVQQLKVSNSMVAIILSTAGPISGFIVQPIIGTYSDRFTSRFGRRRPIILVGSILCAVGMAMLGNSNDLGVLLGDIRNGAHVADHKFGLSIAIVGLWVMNLFVNVIQGPARAIVADIVPEEEQQAGNAMVSVTMGCAAVIANVIGAQFLTTANPYRYLFVIGVVFVIVSTFPTLWAGKETPYVLAPDEKPQGIGSIFYQIWVGFRHMPFPMLRVLVCFFFSWAGFSPFMIYMTAFFGENVKGGDPNNNTHLYYQGVKLGMYALAAFAVVQLVFALAMPSIIAKISYKPTYFISQIISSVALILFLFFAQVPVAFVLSAIVAINFTAFNSIPFALVTSSAAKEDAGLYMGVLNSASVVAQTIANIIAGQIVGACDQNVKWGIFFGGCMSAFGSLLVWTLPNPKPVAEETLQIIEEE